MQFKCTKRHNIHLFSFMSVKLKCGVFLTLYRISIFILSITYLCILLFKDVPHLNMLSVYRHFGYFQLFLVSYLYTKSLSVNIKTIFIA